MDAKLTKIRYTFFEARTLVLTYLVVCGNSNNEYCGEPDKLNDRLSDNQ